MGETLVRAAIQPQLQGPQNRLTVCRRTDTQQAEMINWQVHQLRSDWPKTLDIGRDFAHS
ncbi:MAG: Uncharacterised protein [Prochlorococcus marinus str. MIT 9313]|nr:MAG: Uncharacterised protein [Prochlorococcus marinus str. MIT 9313]